MPAVGAPGSDAEGTGVEGKLGISQRVHPSEAKALAYPTDRITGSWRRVDEYFYTLRELNKENSAILAYMNTRDYTGARQLPYLREDGLVAGHCYSVVQLLETGHGVDPITGHRFPGVKLVELRNLWGKSRWNGPWGDGAPELTEHKDIRRHHLRREHQLKGRFWMSWEAFNEIFDRLEVTPMPHAIRKAAYTDSGMARRPRQGGAIAGWLDTKTCAALLSGDIALLTRCCAVQRGKPLKIPTSTSASLEQ